MTYASHGGLAVVRWLDASFQPGQFEPESLADLNPGQEIETVGFLLRNDDKWVIVASELFEDGQARAGTAIPASIVLEVTRLYRTAP